MNHFPLAISEQFQSSFRAVSEMRRIVFESFSTGRFRAISEQFQSSFRAVSEQFQSSFRAVSICSSEPWIGAFSGQFGSSLRAVWVQSEDSGDMLVSNVTLIETTSKWTDKERARESGLRPRATF